jgi:hypothetical protein
MLVISIQAYIFTMLTAFYIAEAIHGHGDEHGDEHHGEEHETRHETEDMATAAA